MSFIESPARRSFLKAAAGGAVLISSQLFAPAVLAASRTWRKTPDYDVDLKLGLLLDFSSSVKTNENGINEVSLQIDGTAEAFEHPDVITAIKEQPRGIAVNMVHFALSQKEVLPWRILRTEDDSRSFARDIRDAGVTRAGLGMSTYIAPALSFMKMSMADCPYSGVRQVVDISGDGPDNTAGGLPQSIMATMNFMTDLTGILNLKATVGDLAASNITINGIPICNECPTLDEYYSAYVITPSNTYSVTDGRGRKVPVAGGFVKRANGHEDYAAALVNKLVQEIG